MPLVKAYWISPSGKTVPCDTYSGTHIDKVCMSPTQFGYNEPELKKIYKKYKEPYGLEGQAREEIMIDLMKKGWVRVRDKGENEGWVVEVWNIKSSRTKNAITDWLLDMCDKNKNFKENEITINDIKTNSMVSSSTTREILKTVLAESVKSRKKKII